MARFTKRAIAILDGLYKFVGGQGGSAEVDLEASIQLVHDVSRETERASGAGGNGGYLLRSLVLTHPGADTKRGTITILTSLANTNFDVALDDLWLIDVWRMCDTSDGALRGGDSVTFPVAEPDIDVATVLMVAHWGQLDEQIVANIFNLMPGLNEGTGVNDRAPQVRFRPMLITAAATIDMKSASSAACDVTASYMMWYGAKGTTPPGMM